VAVWAQILEYPTIHWIKRIIQRKICSWEGQWTNQDASYKESVNKTLHWSHLPCHTVPYHTSTGTDTKKPFLLCCYHNSWCIPKRLEDEWVVHERKWVSVLYFNLPFITASRQQHKFLCQLNLSMYCSGHHQCRHWVPPWRQWALPCGQWVAPCRQWLLPCRQWALPWRQ